MDRRMPVMDGLEATRRIRALEGGQAVKIVALTASVFAEQRGEMLAAGMDDILHKPFRPTEIFELPGAPALGVRSRQDTARALEAEFQFWANKVVYAIEYRLQGNVQVLRGVAGLFDASESVSRQEFRTYVAALRLEERYPGIQGVGFSLVVSPDQKAAHTAAIRREGFPNYAIYPDGEREEIYTSIIYLEPFSSRNLRAFGYDMFSEPVRNVAMARARDENRATLSGKVTLVQETETDVQAGFLIYVPVYRRDAPLGALEERRANLAGWAYSPLRMHDLMRSVLDAVEFDDLRAALDVEVYDGALLSLDTLMFDFDRVSRFAEVGGEVFRAVRSIEYGGHRWSVLLTSNPVFDARLHNEKSNLIAGAGSAGSALLALLVGVLGWGQIRVAAALRETAQVNQQLATGEKRFRSIFETSLVGISTCGPDLMFTQVNQAFCRLLEYSEGELVGLRGIADVTHPDDVELSRPMIEQVMRREIESFVVEKRYRAKSGRVVAAITAARASYDDAGRFVSITASILDITERKKAEEALRASLEEKTILLKEVHHRVKNNLQIISSLLNLQAERTRTRNPEVLDTLRDTQNRVRSMALLHENLYRSSSLARISLPQYVESLCVQLWRSVGPAAPIELDRQVDAVSLSLDQAVPCGLIVNELVSNALKHAFPDGRSGRVRVRAQARTEGEISLIVADDGVGLPPGRDPRCAETLGLQLVFMLVAQLQGEVDIAREGGTEFRIVFPTKAG
jgi:PAS domain S-box-containing protein